MSHSIDNRRTSTTRDDSRAGSNENAFQSHLHLETWENIGNFIELSNAGVSKDVENHLVPHLQLAHGETEVLAQSPAIIMD